MSKTRTPSMATMIERMTDVTTRCGHTVRVHAGGGTTHMLHLRDEYRHSRVCGECQAAGKAPKDFPPPRR